MSGNDDCVISSILQTPFFQIDPTQINSSTGYY